MCAQVTVIVRVRRRRRVARQRRRRAAMDQNDMRMLRSDQSLGQAHTTSIATMGESVASAIGRLDGSISKMSEKMSEGFDTMTNSMSRMEKSINKMSEGVDRMNNSISRMDERIEKMSEGVNRMNNLIGRMDERMGTSFHKLDEGITGLTTEVHLLALCQSHSFAVSYVTAEGKEIILGRTGLQHIDIEGRSINHTSQDRPFIWTSQNEADHAPEYHAYLKDCLSQVLNNRAFDIIRSEYNRSFLTVELEGRNLVLKGGADMLIVPKSTSAAISAAANEDAWTNAKANLEDVQEKAATARRFRNPLMSAQPIFAETYSGAATALTREEAASVKAAEEKAQNTRKKSGRPNSLGDNGVMQVLGIVELKKATHRFDLFDLNQAFAELVALDAKAPRPVFLLLTNLSSRWFFYWIGQDSKVLL